RAETTVDGGGSVDRVVDGRQRHDALVFDHVGKGLERLVRRIVQGEDTTQVSVAGHGAGGDQRSDRGPGKRSILVKGLERAEMFAIRPARPGLLRVEAVEVRSCVAAEVQLA